MDVIQPRLQNMEITRTEDIHIHEPNGNSISGDMVLVELNGERRFFGFVIDLDNRIIILYGTSKFRSLVLRNIVSTIQDNHRDWENFIETEENGFSISNEQIFTLIDRLRAEHEDNTVVKLLLTSDEAHPS